jgi:hypothetical protein
MSLAAQALNRLAKWRAVLAGWQLGTRPKGDSECDAVRDQRELLLILRAEVNAISALFCDAQWQPILPRKEVYTREFTEAGWRSASQVLAEDGYYKLETEDGRTIETTVDAT